MDDLLREFLTETSESLDTVDNQLVRFEQEPNNAKILDNIFRLVHTIKGTCGFLGLPRLEALAHAGETLMGKFRDGMPVTGEAVTLILTSIDRIKDILSQLEATEAEPEGNDQDLIGELEAMVERGMAAHGGCESAAAGASAVSARRARGDAGHTGRADPGASVASRRSLAGRTGARVPRDRDRGRARSRNGASLRRLLQPRSRRQRQSRPGQPRPKCDKVEQATTRSREGGSQSRRQIGCRKSAEAPTPPKPTASPTSRSASMSTRSNI